MNARTLRAGLRAGAVAGVFSGTPSTLHALLTARSPLDAVRAAGTLLAPDDSSPHRLLLAGAVAHGVISLAWGVVLATLLPRRRSVLWGAGAGLAIAALDLGVVGRRRRRLAALPVLPQLADHAVFGALVGAVLSRTAPRR
jgi:hypothetical protein